MASSIFNKVALGWSAPARRLPPPGLSTYEGQYINSFLSSKDWDSMMDSPADPVIMKRFQQIEDELALIHVQASQNSLVFTSDIKDLKEKLHSTELKLQAAENKLEATEKELEKARHQLGHHDLSFEMVLDLREIIFSTALRLHSASLHLNTNKFLLYQGAVKPVQAPSSLKGGYAAMDAILILERQHIDWLVPFMRIYGVDASVVKEIAEAGHARILRVLNAVGTYRLAGKLELDEGEKEVFEEMVHMIDFKRMEAASDLSRQFPFKKLAFSMDGME